MVNVCYSGGAVGADSLFSECAEKIGHKVVNYVFKGHKSKCNGLVFLTDDELRIADDKLKIVAKILGKKLPYYNPFVFNLLRRNYYQSINSKRIYSAARLNNDECTVKSGTGWSIELAKLNGVQEIYIFNMEDNSWKSWNGFLFENIDFNDIPKPSGHYGGIGSRELTEEAVKQIKMLYEV